MKLKNYEQTTGSVKLIADLCFIYVELQSARLCICLILATWLRGAQISQDPIGHKLGEL